ncbi:MAG: Bax inhibitor-1/YccA family protein [Anaerolineae bacterium]|nr:Bax inhibitor-1/YccA family protein [Anaerolineae bacterium]
MGFYSSDSSDTKVKNFGSIGLDLSAVMRQVYLWMAVGLVVCFGIAYALGQIAQQELTQYALTGHTNFFLFNPAFSIVTLIIYFILAFAVQPVIMRQSIAVGAAVYVLFTAVFGVMISGIFIAYEQTAINTAFIATAAMFGAMSIYGYTTKADLSRLGTILTMAIIGLIVASIVNWFANSSAIYYLISYAGVVIFCGFVAYDTQWIKNTANQVAMSGDPSAAQRVALIGAFHLFYDFVQLFLFILRILGSGSRR